MSIESVLREVQVERQCQNVKYGEEFDDCHIPNDWIAIATRRLGLAANDGDEEDPERFRRQMISVAAVAVAAVESQDRMTGREVVHAPVSGPGY